MELRMHFSRKRRPFLGGQLADIAGSALFRTFVSVAKAADRALELLRNPAIAETIAGTLAETSTATLPPPENSHRRPPGKVYGHLISVD